MEYRNLVIRINAEPVFAATPYPCIVATSKGKLMTTRKYFLEEPRGVNHDLARHKREEEKLTSEIDTATPQFRAAFVSLRKIVREGKAAAAAKIGLPKSRPRRK